MKKILFLFFLLCGHLHALEKESTLKMYHNIFFALSSKIIVSVYVSDKEYKDVFMYSKKIFLVNEPNEADIVLITDKKTLLDLMSRDIYTTSTKTPILFVTDYRLLKEDARIVGAFYWKKGRSQLLFIRSRLKKYGLLLPYEHQKFIIDEL